MKFNNIAGVIYESEWISVAEYEGEDSQENENEDNIEENKEDKGYTECENHESEYQNEDVYA